MPTRNCLIHGFSSLIKHFLLNYTINSKRVNPSEGGNSCHFKLRRHLLLNHCFAIALNYERLRSDLFGMVSYFRFDAESAF